MGHVVPDICRANVAARLWPELRSILNVTLLVILAGTSRPRHRSDQPPADRPSLDQWEAAVGAGGQSEAICRTTGNRSEDRWGMRVADDEGTNLAAAVGRLVWNMVVENQRNHRITAAAAAACCGLNCCSAAAKLWRNGVVTCKWFVHSNTLLT